jgi:hypothetical protein
MARRPSEFAACTLGPHAAVAAQREVRLGLAPALGGDFWRQCFDACEAEPLGDRSSNVAERRLTVFGEVERARRPVEQHADIQIGHVVDVHVRPDVEALADDLHDSLLAGVGDEKRDLHAVGIEPIPHAVDEARANHRRSDSALRRREHREVELATRLLARVHDQRRVFIEDAFGATIAACIVADHARPAGVQQGLARTRQPGDQCAHGAHMVGAGAVDRPVGCARGASQHIGIVQRAEHGVDAAFGQTFGIRTAARQAAHAVSVGEQRHRDRAADVAASAGDEDVHEICPVCSR